MTDNKNKNKIMIMDAEGLSDLAVLILTHLDKINTLDSITEIINLIDYSPIASYKAIFEEVKDFYNTHGRFPDPTYLEAKFTHRYYQVTQGYSPDLFIDFIHQLKKHKKIKDINGALNDFDLDKITEIITKDIKINKKNEDVGIDNILSIYDTLELSPHGMALGIPELDHYIGGMDYGTLNVIAAPVSTYKTTLAISTAYHACFNEGKHVIYLTLEVTPAKVFFDLLARHSFEMGTPLDASALKKGKLTKGGKEILRKVRDDWKKNCKGDIRIIGTSDIEEYTPAYLEAFIQKKSIDMGGLDMLYIDYLNLLKNKIPPQLKLDQYQALNYYTQFFTDMSIRLNYILIMLCQINREGTAKLDSQAAKEGGKKLASTTFFAEANEVERSASVALILHATRSMKNRNNVDIFLVKNRDGACPEEPITCPVVPEYFLVGTKEFSGLVDEDALIDEVFTDPDYAMDDETLSKRIGAFDLSNVEDNPSDKVDLSSMEELDET